MLSAQVARAGNASRGAGVRLRRLRKTYGGADEVSVLMGVDLEVEPGESVAVVGRSGSGKSTLLHLIAGLDRPTAGDITVGDTAVHALSPRRSAGWRARNVGIVFQFFQLLPTLTLLENVVLPMELAGLDTPPGRVRRARQLLDLVEVGELCDRLPVEVSGGQQQRAALARAIANDPPLLLADEPTGNLDEAAAARVEELLLDRTGASRTLILVTHDTALARRADRSVALHDGRVR